MEEGKRTGTFPVFDEEIFAALEQEILPLLMKQARLGCQTLRVWVIECGTGEIPTLLTIMLARLLGNTLPNIRIQIFATDRDDINMVSAHRGIFDKNILSHLHSSEIARFCEPVEDGYRLKTSLRKLIIFGRHDPRYDPFLAQQDLILCDFSLLSFDIGNQQHFLSLIGGSLNSSGYIVFARQDSAVLSSPPYQLVREGVPIYRYTPVQEKPVVLLFAQEHVDIQKDPERMVTTLHQLLHTSSISANGSEEKILEKQGVSAFVPNTLDVLLRLAPIGIIVIDHHYQILSFNRAAYKLLTLLIYEGKSMDFFHAISGLPYQEVRMAIDMVMQEGTSQILEEVELTVSTGGNGRILSMEICSMPTEIGTSPQLVIYIQDITMQTVQKKIQFKQAQAAQELSMSNAHLIRKCNDIERIDEHLRVVSQSLLSEYQHLVTQIEQMQEVKRLVDQQVEQLLEEIIILTKQVDD
jgi:chemotaxis methyl-accepting protein methylase